MPAADHGFSVTLSHTRTQTHTGVARMPRAHGERARARSPCVRPCVLANAPPARAARACVRAAPIRCVRARASAPPDRAPGPGRSYPRTTYLRAPGLTIPGWVRSRAGFDPGLGSSPTAGPTRPVAAKIQNVQPQCSFDTLACANRYRCSVGNRASILLEL
jgi:hypothetical protein